MRLDLIELPEGALDIHRIELVRRYTVRQERKGERSRRAVEERARSRKPPHIPEVGPGLWTAVRELVLAVAQVGAERAVGDAIGEDSIGKQLVLLHDGPVNRLDKALALRAQPVGPADRGDVPLVTSALHLCLELGVGHRRHGLDADTGRLGERLEESGLLRRRPAAAPGIDEYRPRLRGHGPGYQRRADGGSGKRGTPRPQQPASIANRVFPAVHGSSMTPSERRRSDLSQATARKGQKAAAKAQPGAIT